MTNPDREAAVDAIKKVVDAVDDAIERVATPGVLDQVDEELWMPRVGAVSAAVDPVCDAINDAIRADVETTSDGEAADPA